MPDIPNLGSPATRRALSRPRKILVDKPHESWLRANPQQRKKATNRAHKMQELNRYQDYFDTGRIKIDATGKTTDVPPKEENLGLARQTSSELNFRTIVEKRPDVAYFRSGSIGRPPTAHPEDFATGVSNVRTKKPSASRFLTKSRLSGYSGTSGAHVVASVTDSRKIPPHTIHVDPIGPNQSLSTMRSAYLQAFPGTEITESTVKQETPRSVPYTLSCNINSTANTYRALNERPFHNSNNLLGNYRLGWALSQGKMRELEDKEIVKPSDLYPSA